MARNLYDLGDARSSATDSWLREREERHARVIPRGALLLALLLGGVGLLLFKDLIPDPATNRKPESAVTVIDSFRACDETAGRACVLAPDRFAWNGRSYRLGDITGPSLANPACAREGELAREGRAMLLTLMNGGAFEVRPAPDNGAARILTRDGVSLGSLLVIKGYARPVGNGRVDWCEGSGRA